MTDTEQKPDEQSEIPAADVADADLEQVTGGQDFHFTKPIDKSSPVLFQP